jgi:acyl-CoA thioester hydrolase
MIELSKDPRSSFSHVITVIEADLDELGHVNNAVYLKFMEDTARAHSLHIGMGLPVMQSHGVVPVARKHVITYHRPALLNDQLEISTYTNNKGVRAYRRYEIRLKPIPNGFGLIQCGCVQKFHQILCSRHLGCCHKILYSS